ncbi:wall-associated receptor kinase-like 2 isoform X8 [Citrus sinensis]|uniref:wall-associated receptor kinase-like 2 isoform X8 n=1 Tax=Citrus sinensis TaxID=2711 RepID=UPI0022795072|nr:wall-associated receptor kinase-like 2 isoform X8 [Citrus sinensis]
MHALSELKKTEFKRRMAVHLCLVLLQIIVLHLRPIIASERFPCPTECGNVSISYPFGIGEGCYFNKGYEVICDHSSGTPKAFLPGVNRLELLDILPYPNSAAVRVNIPTISLNGSSKRTSNIAKGVNLSGDLICNISSGYNCSNCPDGYNRFSYGCDKVFNKSRVKFIIIGCGGGLALFFLLIGIWWLYKFVKRRREIKLKRKFFKKNGGLLLQQELSSNEDHIEKMTLFTSKDLETATDNYNANRILGQGGQGVVYKGMLADGGIAAIKKSKILDESNLEQFINEVVILSQINHRNVVKLLGCCLETEVPLLVYEFILNGSLDQYIHYESEEFPITWEMRLRIAVEVSGALSYLHSAASIPIYHRDIKSANILLDDKYRAKVSDFGASRSITVDQTHLTTQVQGSFGYLDPEYFRSSHFTDKSDVYSFGVVLVELLTGQKPIRSTVAEEDKSLARYFIKAMKENRLFEVLDDRVLKEAEKEEIITVATLAKRCLNLNGKKRPTMKEVAFELRGIRESVGASILQQNCEETDFVDGDITGHDFERDSSSSGSALNSVSVSVDADPLISNEW